MAYLSVNDAGAIDGFLYLKLKEEGHLDIEPPLPAKRRLKVGTFKIHVHGTKLGDRFVKKIFDSAMAAHVEGIYVTVFEKHEPSINLLERFGFSRVGIKASSNGTELVLVRKMAWEGENLHHNYPLVRVHSGKKYLLGIWPVYHTRLLPDSKLAGEGPNVVTDISHTNSIQKIYLAGRSGAEKLKHGDGLIIYRTSDDQAPAHYRSVATSACIVDKVQSIADFKTEEEFLRYCKLFSVFTEAELKEFYKTRKYPVILTFTYNVSFPKRVTRKILIEELGLDAKARWNCLTLTDEQFLAIMKKGLVDESLIVN